MGTDGGMRAGGAGRNRTRSGTPRPSASEVGRVCRKRPSRRRGIRISAAEQERTILEAAIAFFSEHGFDAPTRILAERIGISHSALYRHFPSKEDLLNRIRDRLFVEAWRPEWTAVLRDRDVPLRDRLLRFYREAAPLLCSQEWIRVALFASLSEPVPDTRLATLLRERVILPICVELRAARGLSPLEEEALTEAEIERGWALHGRIFYAAMRCWVWRGGGPVDLDRSLCAAIASFCDGAPQALARGLS